MNLVIDNDGPQDFPETLTKILEHNFKEEREIWYWFNEAFWPENESVTIKKFMDLKEGSNIICEHTFVDYQQMELLINLLYKFKKVNKPISLYIYNPILPEILKDYIDKYECDFSPKDLGDESDSSNKKFKEEMNSRLYDVIEYHSVYQMTRRCQFKDGIESGLVKITKDLFV
jgi:hypothetical protein